MPVRVSVYAPVGSHEDLLPYLVRRLLENGANTSFVNRIVDETIDVQDIVADPILATRAHDCTPHPHIKPPSDMFGANDEFKGHQSAGSQCHAGTACGYASGFGENAYAPVRSLVAKGRAARNAVVNPANTQEVVGTCKQATPSTLRLRWSSPLPPSSLGSHAGRRACQHSECCR